MEVDMAKLAHLMLDWESAKAELDDLSSLWVTIGSSCPFSLMSRSSWSNSSPSNMGKYSASLCGFIYCLRLVNKILDRQGNARRKACTVPQVCSI